MNALIMLSVAFALAFLTESFVEYVFAIPMKKIPVLEPWTWLLNYVALAVGIGVAFYYSIDMIALIAQAAGGADWGATPVGIVLTGMIIGRGSNFLSDFVGKYLKPK